MSALMRRSVLASAVAAFARKETTAVSARLPSRLFVAVVAASVALAALAMGMGPIAPAAARADVIWKLGSETAPSGLRPGAGAQVIASASNIGQSAVLGTGAQPVIITDRLPAGLEVPSTMTAAEVVGRLEANDRSEAASELVCAIEEAQRREVSCKTTPTTQPLAPYTQLRLTIPVEVLPEAGSGERNTVSVSGGELTGGLQPTPPAPLSQAIQVTGEATAFGIEGYSISPEEEDGSVDARAGSHPFQLTTTLDLNKTLAPETPAQPELEASSPALTRELGFELPPGLLGDPRAIPQCSDTEFASIGENNANSCPADSAIGVALVTLNLPSPPLGVFTEAVPVFNLVPAPGEPARFGLEDTKVPIILDTSVRTAGDYGVTVTVRNTTQLAGLLDTQVVLWGEPENPSHNASRGWACLHGKEINGEKCEAPLASTTPPPFLTLPTSCTGTLSSEMSAQAWNGATAQQTYTLQTGLGEPLTSLQDCDALPFSPSIGVLPVEEHEGATPGATQSSASTPTGLNVEVSLPPETDGLGESAVRQATVTLPPGLELNPSAANGLEACTEAQAGYEGEPLGPDPLAPGASEPLRFSAAPATCPQASKVGLVRVKSPDLAHELTGGVYLAQPAPNGEPAKNPFDSLIALYLIAEDPASGIRVKLAGEGSLNQTDGQIASTFTDTPQVPFETLRLHFFEGPHSSLTTPSLCGTYTTTGRLTPWSGTPPAEPSSSFSITTGPEGSGCADPLAFAPGLKAGSASPQAGAFTSFNLNLTDPDADQRLDALSVHLPPGVAAILASVTPCPERQAAQERCGAESLIGQSLASAGYGPEPYELPGSVYLTGPYQGAPFGIEVITPAVAGPFNLGTVTVRSRIEVDPHTAAVTITSDPIPQLVKGLPSQIKQLQVTVNRPGFEFNPTSCNPGPVTATLTGNQGARSTTSYPFNTSNCASLPFHPGVSATTEGKTSKADGASLGLTFKSTAGEAHVAKTILTIPATLPARLTTIQKACIAAVFETNPAACPEGSDIGAATVHTPVLKSPVAGPIYLVSHGNAAWPDAELVLQGEGITVILDGQTAIKKGITTSSFLSVPNVPFETVQATLPEGPHSALTTNLPAKDNYNLCGQRLTIPAALTGQNGTAVNQTAKVNVQGCHAVKARKTTKLTRHQQLTRALGACDTRYKRSRAKRTSCERLARRRYRAR